MHPPCSCNGAQPTAWLKWLLSPYLPASSSCRKIVPWQHLGLSTRASSALRAFVPNCPPVQSLHALRSYWILDAGYTHIEGRALCASFHLAA